MPMGLPKLESLIGMVSTRPGIVNLTMKQDFAAMGHVVLSFTMLKKGS